MPKGTNSSPGWYTWSSSWSTTVISAPLPKSRRRRFAARVPPVPPPWITMRFITSSGRRGSSARLDGRPVVLQVLQAVAYRDHARHRAGEPLRALHLTTPVDHAAERHDTVVDQDPGCRRIRPDRPLEDFTLDRFLDLLVRPQERAQDVPARQNAHEVAGAVHDVEAAQVRLHQPPGRARHGFVLRHRGYAAGHQLARGQALGLGPHAQ